jgi:hypothetical protein
MSEQPEALRLADALDVGEISYTGMCQAAAELRRLHAVNAELLEALKEAALAIEYWGSYASKYFQEKHDLQGDVDAADYVIAKAEAA